MEKKRGRGRPPKPPKEVLSEVVQLRVSADERKTLEIAADGKLSAWARDVLLIAAKRQRKKKPPSQCGG
jgi:hypothetical protein